MKIWPHAIVLFSIMLAHALLETARDAVFLGTLGPDALASAYIAIAAVALSTMAVARRFGVARHPRRMLVVFLTIGAVGTLGLGVSAATAESAAFVLYLWTGVVATLVMPSFWVVAEHGLRVADAKRGFGIIAAGGGLGAFAGASIAWLLSRVFTPQYLVIAAGIAFAMAAVTAAILAPADTEQTREKDRVDDAAGSPSRSPGYVHLLLLLGAIATVVLTLGDLMFKRVLAERVPAADLAAWLGATYAGLNVLALVVQLLVTGRLLNHAGVGAALTFLPLFVLSSALGFVLTGALAAVIALKLADGGLRHSLHRVASEILFLPVASSVRGSAKPMVDALAQRGGQAVAAVATIVLASDARTLALTIVVAVVVWLIAIAFTRAAYVEYFRATLEAKAIQRDVRIPALDADSVAMLTSALASPDEAEAAAAIDLLATREEGLPALVLYHPSAAVVRRALRALRGELRPDVVRVLQHLFTHPDPEVRSAAIAVSSRTGQACPASALADPDPHVRAASAVAMYEQPGSESARAVVAALVEGAAVERLALARAIGNQPSEAFRDVLVNLLARREPAVAREVLKVWTGTPALADEACLLSLLSYSYVRGDARRAIIAAGSVERLIVALDDPRTPIGVRRHLPRTISRFHSPSAAAALVARLLREPDGTTEFKILRALGRMRANDTRLEIDAAPLRRYVARSLDDAGRYRRLRTAMMQADESPTVTLLDDLLDEKRRFAVERAFRALGILHPEARLHSIHDAMTSGDVDLAAAAREILDEAVPPEQRGPLVDELEQRDRGPVLNYTSEEAALRALLVDPSESLRCIAAHHVAQRHLVTLRDELVRLKPTMGSELVTLAFDQAIASLHA